MDVQVTVSFSLAFLSLTHIFLDHGKCNVHTSTCECDYPYFGNDCSTSTNGVRVRKKRDAITREKRIGEGITFVDYDYPFSYS